MNTSRVECHLKNLKIFGVINFETVTHLYKQGMAFLMQQEEVQVDFAAVSHTDSSAIALLLSWIRLAKSQQKRLGFMNLPGQMLEIANVCEVMPFLEDHIISK